MGFMSLIIEALNSVSSWFYGLYLDCYYAGWPLSAIASWFYSLCTVFNNLAWQFYYFSVWVSDVASKVQNILTSEGVLGLLKWWFPWLEKAGEWLPSLRNDWNNFWTITWPQWTTKLDTVKANWDYFWSITFPTLVSFTWLTTWWSSRLTDIQNLINSAFLIRQSFWEGWQDWRGKVTEFFTDPEEWLYKAADRIIERFW